MRAVRQDEIENWNALAKRHGFGAAEGRFTLGRFIVEHRDDSGFVLCAITPIPARLNTAATPAGPVMFDRTPCGEIVVPGRWWHVMFEEVSADHAAPAAMRHMAARMAATTACHDVVLPADSDTVEIAIQDSRGHLTSYEAVPPGSRMLAKIERLPIMSGLEGRPSRSRRRVADLSAPVATECLPQGDPPRFRAPAQPDRWIASRPGWEGPCSRDI